MLILLLMILFVLSGTWLLLQSEAVQNRILPRVLTYLNEELHLDLKVQHISLSFFDEVKLQGVLIPDHQADTLIYADNVWVEVDGIFSGKIQLSALQMDGTIAKVIHYPQDSLNSLQLWLKKFPNQNPDKKEKKPFQLVLDALDLELKRLEYLKDDPLKGWWVQPLKLSLEDIQWLPQHVSANIVSLSGRELIRELNIENLQSQLLWKDKVMELGNCLLQLPGGSIDLDGKLVYSALNYSGLFSPDVTLDLRLAPSRIALRDVKHFLPKHLHHLHLDLEGKLKGNAKRLQLDDFWLAVNRNALQAKLSGYMEGLDSNLRPFFKGEIERFEADGYFLQDWYRINQGDELPAMVRELQFVRAYAWVEGYPNDFSGKFNIKTNLGKIHGDLNLDYDSLLVESDYRGYLAIDDLNLKKILNQDHLGKMSFKGQVDGYGLKLDLLRAKANAEIPYLEINGYTYTNIQMDGDLASGLFEGDLNVLDSNLSMTFNGKVDFRNKLPVFDFDAELRDADLYALHLVEDSVALLNTSLSMDFSGNNLDNLEGKLVFSQTTYASPTDYFFFNDFILEAHRENKVHTIAIQSDLLEAKLWGDFNLKDLPGAGQHLLEQYFSKYKAQLAYSPVNLDFELKVNNTLPISKLFYQDLSLDYGTQIRASFDSEKDNLYLDLICPELKYKEQVFKQVRAQSGIGMYGWETVLFVDELKYSKDLSIDSLRLHTRVRSDSCQYRLDWDYRYDYNNSGFLHGYLTVNDSNAFVGGFYPSSFFLADIPWDLSGGSRWVWDQKALDISGLQISNENQQLTVDGKLSSAEEDKLWAKFEGFQLSTINELTESAANTSLAGEMDGVIGLRSAFSRPGFEAQIGVDSLFLNGFYLGDLQLDSRMDSLNARVAFTAGIQAGRVQVLQMQGEVDPRKDKNSLQATASLNKLRLAPLKPYVEKIMSPLDGWAYGNLKVTGTVKEPELTGDLNLKRTRFGIAILNTSYNIDGDAQVHLGPNEIVLKPLTLRDQTGLADHYAKASGTLKHKYFRDFELDIRVDMNQLLCLNTTARDNDLYYGTAYGTGSYHLTGTPKQLKMDIVAKANRGTKFYIPMSSSSTIVQQDFIRFVGANAVVDSSNQYRANLSGIELNFDLEIDDQTELDIIFDASVGDIIHARGNANLQLEISTLGQFNMYGNYYITEGEYLFTLERVINKRFRIDPGGTIQFTGDPYNAQLNVNAYYSKRISVYPLQLPADTSGNKIPVEVWLNISESLSTPTITPSIKLPNSSDALRSQFQDRLRDESELNTQVFAVLVLNQFVPPSGFGGINLAQGGISNASEMLFNQLSNMMSQFSDNYDLGVNYRDGNQQLGQSDEVELNISTQFFNDRLSLNGNFGVPLEQNTSSLVGDFLLEYDLTPDRRIKVKAYNRNNEYDPLLDNSSTTYGLGIIYREEFDEWSELWKKWMSPFRKMSPPPSP